MTNMVTNTGFVKLFLEHHQCLRWADTTQDTYVFPLRDTTFEGFPAKIPFQYEEMLASEYGERALWDTKFNE